MEILFTKTVNKFNTIVLTKRLTMSHIFQILIYKTDLEWKKFFFNSLPYSYININTYMQVFTHACKCNAFILKWSQHKFDSVKVVNW